MSWKIFFKRVTSGRIKINKEVSMQLHYASILNALGELFCIVPGETFSLELETHHLGKNVDVTCGFGDTKAAIELKCFRKSSNRARDVDLYHVWEDIVRLSELDGFKVRHFICLTDDAWYPRGQQQGYAETFSIADKTTYPAGKMLEPGWAGTWKDKSKDRPLKVPRDIAFEWVEESGWFYCLVEL